MDNHVHLLIRESEEENIAAIMKRIGVRYVAWYNRKYNRCGHLFQDRFQSEAVESDAYLLTVLRYIHQNPVKAGLVKKISDYWSSSYCEYINMERLIDADFILGIFSTDKEQARKNFIQFMNEVAENDNCLEYKEQATLLKDEEIRALIKARANMDRPLDLQTMKKSERDVLLREIKKIDGISTRQIARLTGISQSVIAKA